MRLAAIACFSLLFSVASAAGAERRYVTAEEAPRWAGVGLLVWTGRGSCTAVLVRADLVLTAAHCVSEIDRKTVAAPRDLTFNAGVFDGRSLRSVQARSVAVHPGYFVASVTYGRRRVRVDIARVTLTKPINEAPSYPVGETPPVGGELTLVSYPGTRRARASLQAPCPIVSRETEFLLLDCLSEPGASGSPYFHIGRDGKPRVVGLNSGRRERGGEVHALALAFAHVRDFIRGGGRGVGAASSGGVVRRSAPPAGEGSGARLPDGSRPGSGLRSLR